MPQVRRRPTGRGAMLIVAGVGLFLLATHFSSNAVFLLAFACVAMPLAAPIAVWSALRDARISAIPPTPSGAGEAAQMEYRLDTAPVAPGSLRIETALGAAHASRHEARRLVLKADDLPRGVHDLGDMTLAAYDPLGLFRVARALHSAERQNGGTLVIYPRPDWTNPASAARSGVTGQRKAPSGEPAGLRPYRPGDLRRDVDWRASARADQLMVREYEESSDLGACVFDWKTEAKAGVEPALSRLAAGVLEAARNGASPGLRLPGVELEPDRGPRHLEQLLRALAAHPSGGAG